MASWADVRRLATGLPEATEVSGHGHTGGLAWKVRGKTFAWERPLRLRDLDELGARAPDGPILAARVADEGEKQALLAEDAAVFFTTSHFDGFPAILVDLRAISSDRLAELVEDAWLVQAPKRVAAAWRADR